MNLRITILAAAALAAGCAPKRIHEQPIMENGDRVAAPAASVEVARETAARDNAAASARRDEIAAQAAASCTGDVCRSLARGEVALGMTQAQVLASTRTTDASWSVRSAGASTVMVPVSLDAAPRDASGEVAMVQLRDGRVGAISYREAQGVRVVSSPADATTGGRAAALADALVREGDDLAARGDFTGALNRYDRAQILSPNDALIDYRIATSLDKQLRPIEAQLRYRLFLHRLELEKIEAIGDANAKLADAIAQARQRLIVLEKRSP